MASVIAFDVNETLLDLGALDAPFEAMLGDAALRPQWSAQMLQLAFVGGLTGPVRGTSPPPSGPRSSWWASGPGCRWAPTISTAL